ncbi:hypothetical protein EON64_14180, partial [archaeon]
MVLYSGFFGLEELDASAYLPSTASQSTAEISESSLTSQPAEKKKAAKKRKADKPSSQTSSSPQTTKKTRLESTVNNNILEHLALALTPTLPWGP